MPLKTGIPVLQGGEDVKDGMHIKRLAFLDLIKEEAEKTPSMQTNSSMRTSPL